MTDRERVIQKLLVHAALEDAASDRGFSRAAFWMREAAKMLEADAEEADAENDAENEWPWQDSGVEE